MSFNVLTILPFDKQLKRVSKKYPSLKAEYALLITSLEENPHQGTPLIRNCYKIRFAIESKGKVKSGGARIITNIVIEDEIGYLLSIYDKSEKENLTDKELEQLLNFIEP